MTLGFKHSSFCFRMSSRHAISISFGNSGQDGKHTLRMERPSFPKYFFNYKSELPIQTVEPFIVSSHLLLGTSIFSRDAPKVQQMNHRHNTPGPRQKQQRNKTWGNEDEQVCKVSFSPKQWSMWEAHIWKGKTICKCVIHSLFLQMCVPHPDCENHDSSHLILSSWPEWWVNDPNVEVCKVSKPIKMGSKHMERKDHLHIFHAIFRLKTSASHPDCETISSLIWSCLPDPSIG